MTFVRPINSTGMDPVFEAVLKEKYNILDIIESKEFDLMIDTLLPRLANKRKDQFDALDRFVVVKFDSDFYWHGHGVSLNNLFEVWRYLDIPFYTMFIYTNHIGLTAEVENLCRYQHTLDRPTVFETMLNAINRFPEGVAEPDMNIQDIQHHAISMMAGAHRSHRIATYSSLRDIDPQRLVMSIKKTHVSRKN